MKHTVQQWSLILSMVLMSGAALAQSDTGLPALPPGMDAPPTVQLPTPAPMTDPAPAQLPDVVDSIPLTVVETPSIPQTVNEAGEIVTLRSPGDPATPPQDPAVDTEFKPSYGEFQQSLLYSPEDIDRMKKVLTMYESVKRPEGVVAEVKDEFTELLNQPVVTIQEPVNYPSYHLSSIVFRSPRDWIFWMNGGKYTPKKLPGGLEVLAVSPRAITFLWAPEYIAQAQSRFEKEMYDQTMPAHFKASQSKVRMDKDKKSFIFTLAPNQSFVAAAFGVYEGKYAERAMPAMMQEAQVEAMLNENPDPTVAGEMRDPDAELKATMQDLQKMNGNLTKLAPRNNPNTGANSGADGTTPAQQPTAPTEQTPMMDAAPLPTIQRAM